MSIMDKYSMLDNIRAHSIMVSKVAYILSYSLKETGNKICIKKTIAASLLHDIGKTIALRSGGNHAKIGMDICLENGFDEIANIVAEHVILKQFDLNPPCTEKEIVYYSDKRVNHDKVVSLDERLSYILQRYGRNDDRMHESIKSNFDLCRKIEKKIFKGIPIFPEDLPTLVNDVCLDEKNNLIGWQKKITYLK